MFQKKQLIWSKLVGGWKKLCGFVKMKTRREEVSTATRLNVFFWKGIPVIFVSGMSGHHCFKNTKMNYINLNKNKPSYLFVKWPFATKVETFQQLCLILNPMLQVGGSKRVCFVGDKLNLNLKPIRNLTLATNLTRRKCCFDVPIKRVFLMHAQIPNHITMQGLVDEINEKIRQRRAAKEDCNFKFVLMEVWKTSIYIHALIYCATDLKTIGKTFSETAMIERWFYFIWFCLKTI